jgi:hypothetical protein
LKAKRHGGWRSGRRNASDSQASTPWWPRWKMRWRLHYHPQQVPLKSGSNHQSVIPRQEHLRGLRHVFPGPISLVFFFHPVRACPSSFAFPTRTYLAIPLILFFCVLVYYQLHLPIWWRFYLINVNTSSLTLFNILTHSVPHTSLPTTSPDPGTSPFPQPIKPGMRQSDTFRSLSLHPISRSPRMRPIANRVFSSWQFSS